MNFRQSIQVRKFAVGLCVFCSPLVAGEYAVLANGFRIHASAHEVDGANIQLHTDQGVIQVPVASVTSFEQEEYTPPPPPKPEPVVAAAPAAPQKQYTPKELVTRAAERAGLAKAAGLVQAVAHAESAYNVNAVSPKGALGLMQLMPGTAAALNADPRNPQENAEAGAMYLRQLLERYEGDPHQVSKAVAAYNAGPGAVDKYHGIPPYKETVNYVRRVLREYEKSPQTP